jgi:quercetin dioxygenase-like cupin family protein
MKLCAITLAGIMTWGLTLALAHRSMSQQPSPRLPLTFALECDGGDCPLLKGTPQTAGMRSGYVRLKRGESVGWHSTGQHEEALVILQGKGRAQIEGQPDIPIHARTLAYIPPDTRHDVTNSDDEILEYVWVVAAAADGR